MRILTVGLGVTGLAIARHAQRHGWECVVTEDHPERAGHAGRRAEAEALGAAVVEAPAGADWAGLLGEADLVVPSPGVPVEHPIYTAATDSRTPLVSEIELAARATACPIVAVTGTNGKTTVTTLIEAMLRASGQRATAAGNIGRPLLDAINDDVDVIVAEVSSFQLQYTERFRPRVAVVLNIAHDHLDWHPTFAHYRDAKARLLANQDTDDVAVLNADDEAVATLPTRGRVVWFSAQGRGGAFRRDDGVLVTAAGETIVPVSELASDRPHDVANALAASAASLEAGATRAGVATALRGHRGLPHRVALVGDAGGVRWYDDSKATNPHATLAALAGFDSVVLLAGGRNKGLPLSVLRSGVSAVRAVVAFGEAGAEVEAAFAGMRPVTRVQSMREAVGAAARLVHPGDAVLLSPACASYDAYSDYAARGDDFAAEVRRVLAGSG